MWRFTKAVIVSVVLVGSLSQAFAFTLLGPTTDWMTTPLGYGPPNLTPSVALGGTGGGQGGPMNLGEEYRWNVPTAYFAFSPAFKEFFGQRGIEEIEKAIKILNDLPSMDTLNVEHYPLSSQRINYQAQALGLLDLKSFVLSYLIHVMGITDPTRYVFTVRNRYIIANTTNYVVIQRNYDPVTWEPSSFINGQLWTYTTVIDSQDVPTTLTANETVDPLALQGLIHAPVTSGWLSGLLQFGGFWTGLTRDDVGGLKYIYRSDNFNLEQPPQTASRGGFGGGTVGGGDSPWTVPVIPPPPGAGGGGVVVNPATNFITVGVRPGINKLSFVRVDFESQVGFFPSNTVAFTDRVITNGRAISQQLVRPLVFPDILFDAGDLQEGDADQSFPPGFNTENAGTGWLTNGVQEVSANRTHWGPGIIPTADLQASGFVLTLNNVGPALLNFTPFALSENLGARLFRWGSFDGSTNAPIVYPQGASIREIEDQVLGGGGGSGGGGVGLVDTWTPAATVLIPVGTNLGGGGAAGGGGTTTP